MQRQRLTVVKERAILVACLLVNHEADPHDPLSELRALADTAGATVVNEVIQKRTKPQSATFIGKGKTEELAAMVERHGADVVILDNDLTPSQIANIEKVLKCKVLDRSELILDIFAARASTHQAKLQVELAQLEYTYPRLRAMWTHLERIVGGAPTGIGTRGPGEQQLEVDRRIVQRKKSVLKREIRRIQARKAREVRQRNMDFFTVGLVGYTNAGKSTLFNTATKACGGGGAYADDKLFATLSTRTRRWDLGMGDAVMLSDTVGFVRNLPHHLVASFKATLEEAIHSDLLLIVLDASHPRAHQHLRIVYRVLDEIGANAPQRLLVLNKIDKLKHNADLLVYEREMSGALPISAITGQGMDVLAERLRTASRGKLRELTLTVCIGDGKAIAFLENRAEVLDRRYDDTTVTLTIRIGQRRLDQLWALGTSARLPDEDQPAGAERSGWGS